MPTKGPRTVFRPKTARGSYTMTPLARSILIAARNRAGGTESDVMELLARRFGARVTAADFAEVVAEDDPAAAANG